MLGNLENAGTETPKRKKAAIKPKAAKPVSDRHSLGPTSITADDVREFISSADSDTVSDLQAYIALEVTGRREKVRAELEAKAAAIGASIKWPGSRKGEAAPVKYRGPNGETWAGRGMKPVWLREQLEKGRMLEDFAV